MGTDDVTDMWDARCDYHIWHAIRRIAKNPKGTLFSLRLRRCGTGVGRAAIVLTGGNCRRAEVICALSPRSMNGGELAPLDQRRVCSEMDVSSCHRNWRGSCACEPGQEAVPLSASGLRQVDCVGALS